MRRNDVLKAMLVLIAAVNVLVVIGASPAQAQQGPSVSISYDVIPFQKMDDPIVNTITDSDTTYFNDPRVRLRKLRATFSYPVAFAQGKTVLVNNFSYQLIEFDYKNWDYPLKRLHAASYTLMLQQRLSQKWSMWALGTPSIASDLEAEVSEDDFNIEIVGVFIRHFSQQLSVGAGVAYTTQFGSGEWVPILAFDWNNGKNLMVRAIIPTSLEFWYRPGPRVDLGLIVSGDGNSYRGDPEIYGVEDPELRYTMMTVGPAAKIHLTKLLQLNIEAGLIGLHRFEFYDGNVESGSYDLKLSQYLRIGLRVAG
ncbi:MAG: hypothetical protein JSU65_01895 [Candidatus Zixiibacteriota bacterium]|nr:MAG: hypothetical protein JSU65_01895 [candidate division Zixibacteria bacterium]